MLKSFFQKSHNEELSVNTIRRFDVDKFKPLNNFLKKGCNTHEKNLELLAWLIDFPARPYDRYFRGLKNLLDSNRPLGLWENQHIENIKQDNVHTYNHKAFSPAPEVFISSSGTIQKITVEYPTGVKLCIEGCDFSLISHLVRLG